ncbi:MAG: hypothetical protein ACFN4D_05510, partial [Cardiobacterium sp.]
MSPQITLEIRNSNGNVLAQYPLDSASSPHIAAVDGAYYQIGDAATGTAPANLTTARAGDDLYLYLDGDSRPALVIDHYYSQGQGALVGVQADGSLTSYPVATAPEHALASEIVTEQPLGSDQPALAPLGVLGAVGLVAGAIGISRDHGYKGEQPQLSPNPQPSPKPNP